VRSRFSPILSENYIFEVDAERPSLKKCNFKNLTARAFAKNGYLRTGFTYPQTKPSLLHSVTTTAICIMSNQSQNTFVVFSLHAHILAFAVQECMVGDALLNSGVTPVLMRPQLCTCDILQSYENWRPFSQGGCPNCAREAKGWAATTPGWDHQTLSSYGTPEDLIYVNNQLSKLTPENLADFTIQGVEVGRAALHDTLLLYKLDTIAFPPDSEVWSNYKSLVRACALTTVWIRRALRILSPRGVIIYNSNYAINRSVSIVAGQENILWFAIHAGTSVKRRWNTLLLTRGEIGQHLAACQKNWTARYADRILQARDVDGVGQHFRALFEGRETHVYSAPAGATPCDSFIAKINPTGKRKVIIVATSSPDEKFAVEQANIRPIHPDSAYTFPSQIDLLDFLIAKVKQRPDLSLIIRVHPREFPNKREQQTSANGRLLRQRLTDLPDNVVVNWPEDNLSFYDLIQRVDLVLTAWSTVLLEASLFGCPIILPKSPVIYYEATADLVCEDPESYWEAIVTQVELPWTLDRSLRTFRWYWLNQLGSHISLDSQFTRKFRLRELLARGYRGGIKELRKRSVRYQGEGVVTQTLMGTLDPLEDFRVLGKLQHSDPDPQWGTPTPDELKLVLQELQNLLSILAGPSKNTSSQTTGKIQFMMQAAQAELKSKLASKFA